MRVPPSVGVSIPGCGDVRRVLTTWAMMAAAAAAAGCAGGEARNAVPNRSLAQVASLPKRLDAEPHEVGGAEELHCVEQPSDALDQRAEAEGNSDDLHVDAGAVPEHREHRGAAAKGDGAADHEQHAGAGYHDDGQCGQGKAEQGRAGDHAGRR